MPNWRNMTDEQKARQRFLDRERYRKQREAAGFTVQSLPAEKWKPVKKNTTKAARRWVSAEELDSESLKWLESRGF